MNKYKKFILQAQSSRKRKTGSTQAPGFGAPAVAKNTKKPTKEQLVKWYSYSQKYQDAYLKKYPNSVFSNAPKKEGHSTKVITRSKKISRSATAVALTQKSLDVLKSWGVKSKKITKETAHKMINHAANFLEGKDREKYSTEAVANFKKFQGKIPKADQEEAEKEAEEISKSNVRPSKKYSLMRGVKAVLPGLIGMAFSAALFNGFIPPEALAFIGVKILDAGWDAIKHVTHESGGVAAFLAGSVIKDYMKSKDSDDDVENIKNNLEKQHGKPEDKKEDGDETEPTKTEETKTEPSKTEETKPESQPEPAKQNNIKLKDGSKVTIPDGYEEVSPGNWKRKK